MDNPPKSIVAGILLVCFFNVFLPQTGIFLFEKEEIIEDYEEPVPVQKYPVLASLDSPLIFDEKGIVSYIVQPGDSVSSIAASFGISEKTIVWANKLNSKAMIRKGQRLEVLPVTGIKHKVSKGQTIDTIAKKFKADVAKIIAFNNLPENGQLQIGQVLIIPDGQMPISPEQPRYSEAAKKYAYLPSLDDYFIIPTTGRISQRLHGHNAIDIANSCGSSVLAAASGKVIGAVESGYNQGAGKYVKISHSNGTETLYAHLSEVLVSLGQDVSQGQKIGLIGHTGRTIPQGPRGCHLHWEVHNAKNPLAQYSKNSYLE